MNRRAALAALLPLALAGCTRLYYAGMEKMGREKRDILSKRILDGKKDQERAKEQIKTTLEAFQELTGFDGGDLEKVYKKLNGEFEKAEGRAKDVSDRIDSIEKVAGDLFREWEQEIAQMRDRELKARSRGMLLDTRQRSEALLKKMHEVERRMKPVIAAFRDKVLFLKHNLNARAIASLKKTGVEMDAEVTKLMAEIEASVKEADAFIAAMGAEPR